MGEIELREGRIDDARALLKQSADEEKSGGVLLSLARIEWRDGQTQSALGHLRDALVAHDASQDPALRGEVLLTISDVTRDKGDVAASRTPLTEALKGLVQSRNEHEGDARARARVERALARVLDRFGAIQPAQRALERAYAAAPGDKHQATQTIELLVGRAFVRADLPTAREGLQRAVAADLDDDDLVYFALWVRLLERAVARPDGRVAGSRFCDHRRRRPLGGDAGALRGRQAEGGRPHRPVEERDLEKYEALFLMPRWITVRRATPRGATSSFVRSWREQASSSARYPSRVTCSTPANRSSAAPCRPTYPSLERAASNPPRDRLGGARAAAFAGPPRGRGRVCRNASERAPRRRRRIRRISRVRARGRSSLARSPLAFAPRKVDRPAVRNRNRPCAMSLHRCIRIHGFPRRGCAGVEDCVRRARGRSAGARGALERRSRKPLLSRRSASRSHPALCRSRSVRTNRRRTRVRGSRWGRLRRSRDARSRASHARPRDTARGHRGRPQQISSICRAPAAEKISALASNGRLLTVVQTLDPGRDELPFAGTVRLRAMEGDAVVETDAETTRAPYLAALAELTNTWKSAAMARGGRFVRAVSGEDPVGVVRAIGQAVR